MTEQYLHWGLGHRKFGSGMRSCCYLALAAVLVVLITTLGPNLAAQVTTADIVGTVTDPSGAAVAGATVTVKNDGTGATHVVKSGSNGDYTLTLLQVGTYTLTVEATGFKGFVSRNITLAAGDRARVDATLAIGQTNQTVEVAATTPALESDSSTVGTLITSRATQDLPLNGRNIIQLVELSPGVGPGLSNAMSSGTRPDDRRLASNYSANGQTDEVNNNMIDGMDNNERFIGTIGVRPSIDAIQEVRVLTNLYTAEIGRSVGGVVDLITKSGTNNFHGSVFEFFRNDIFDSNNWVPNPTPHRPKAELRQNQFGGSLGGPIIKNKTFFFGDYEGFRQVKGISSTSTVPTLFEEQNPGNFSDVGGPVVPTSSITPIGLAYFKLYPAPTTAATANNFTFTSGRTQTTNDFDVRIDHHINDQNSIFGRYSFNNVNTLTPGNLPLVGSVNPGTGPFGTFPGPAKERQQSIALQFVHLFRPSLLLELKAGFLRSNIASLPLNFGKNLATQFGFPCTATSCINTSDPVTSGLPSVNFNNGGYSALGDDAFVPLTTIDNTFQYQGAVTWTRGVHSFKFGTGFIRRRLDSAQSSYPRGNITFSNFTGNSLGDLLTGQAATVTRGNTLISPNLRAWEPSAYAQDDWRAKRWLTLNLGIRYDIFTPFTAANGAFSNFDPALGLLISPALPGLQHSGPTVGVKTDYKDVAPRIGFAATVGKGTVVRGGFGMSFFPGSYASGAAMRNAPFTFNFSCGAPGFNSIPCTAPFATGNKGFLLAAGLPTPTLDITLATDPTKYVSFNTTDFHYKASYLEQYTLQIEKEFLGNVATIGYVGNSGRRITIQQNVNQLPIPIAAGGAYPFASLPRVGINERLSQGVSNYNALQLAFLRRLSGGLALNANYTWAHNLTNAQVQDEGQPIGNCVGPCFVDSGHGTPVVFHSWNQYDYGNADLDVRHRVAVSLNYDLPFGKSLTGPRGMLVKGWSVNSIYFWSSGTPFTVQNSNGVTSGINLGNDRPDVIGPIASSNPTPQQWFNVSAFQKQATGTLGNERRNQVFGPPQRSLSFSLFKDFPVREAIHLQFRAETFNLLNQANYANPGSTIRAYGPGGVATTGGGFGQISALNPSADMRQIQLALKLLF
jgi:Carboxypeptidase regulatory-like domain